jgi:hypothetical protein
MTYTDFEHAFDDLGGPLTRITGLYDNGLAGAGLWPTGMTRSNDTSRRPR